MKNERIRTEKLKRFLQFLLENCLDQVVAEVLRRAREIELPLLSIFKDQEENDLFDLFRKSTSELFKEIISLDVQSSYLFAEKLRTNNYPGFKLEQIDVRDIALSYNVRKQSLFSFISLYTDNLAEGLEIIKETEDFFSHRQNLVFQVFTDYHTEKLRNSENNFKSLVEASFEGIVIHDGEVVLEANPMYCNMFGYEREEVVGKKLKDFAAENEFEKLTDKIRSGYRYAYEAVAKRKDGSEFTVEIIGRGVVYKGQEVRVAGLRDITERKKQEEEKNHFVRQLQKEKEFVETLLDNAVDRILAFDENYNITAWNKRMEETGILKENAIGRNLFELFPDYRGQTGYMEEVWKGRKVELRSLQYKYSPGFYDSDLVPLYDSNKEIKGVITFTRNITEKKLAEEKLKESENLLRQITDSTPSHIYVFDYIENKGVYNNKELLDFLGYTKEEIERMGFSSLPQLIHPEDLPQVYERQKKYENAGDNEILYLEYRIKNARGEWRWHSAYTKVFRRTPEGKLWQVLGIAQDITEKKQSDEKLEESRWIFQNILDAIPVFVFWKDDKNNLLGFNKAYQQAINRPAEELLARTADEMYPDADKFLEDDLEVIRTGEPKLNIIESVFTPKGTFWAKTDKVPFKNREGKTIGVIGSAIDITEMKELQEQLHTLNTELEKIVTDRTREALEREKHYRFLADFVPQIFWTADAEGNIDYYNKNWFEYTGLSFEESAGWGWVQVFHPEDVETTFEIWKECLRTGSPYQHEYRYRRASDNTYRWHLGRAVPLKDQEGNVIKWFGTSTDIHDHKSAEESLLLQALILENMEEGVSVSDEKGIIIYTNKAEDKMFGYLPGELTGKHVMIQNAYPPEENERIVGEVFEKLRTNGFWSGEWHNVRKDGSDFYTYSHITTLSLKGKNLFVCIQRDITDEKNFRETIIEQNNQLTRINNDLDNFIYTASHDLKAPISNLEGLMVALAEAKESGSGEEFDHVMDLINASIERFRNTILDLTEVSKAQRSNGEEISHLLISKEIDETKEIISEEIRKTGAEIIKDTERCEEVFFSRKNFRSILYNLISNAIKYRSQDRNPVIKVSSYLSEEFAVLEVEDNGLGINPRNRDKVFDMFRRFHNHVEGSGVGLYIVKRIIDNAGGKIELDSEPGKGTTFRVYFRRTEK